MSKRLLAVTAWGAVILGGAQVRASYVGNFDTAGSSADFTVVHTNGVDSAGGTTTGFVEVTDGDDQLQVTAQKLNSGNAQIRYFVSPTNASGVAENRPTGSISNYVSFSVRISDRSGGDETFDDHPFVAMGIADFVGGTVDVSDKIIVQISNDLDQIILARADENLGNQTTFATFGTDGGASIYQEDAGLELQIADSQARVLYAGTEVIPWTAYLASDPTWTLGNKFDGQLMPFVGVIRGTRNSAVDANGGVENGESITSGFDDLNFQAVPEPGAAMAMSLATCGLIARRRRPCLTA